MSSDAQFDAALDLLRRLAPTSIPKHLTNLTTLVPSITEDLLSSVDQPLATAICPSTSRTYLLCDYNRDSDSYRSPWSNDFNPPLPAHLKDDASYPSDRVRKMEVEMNQAFDVYRQMYYEGGVGSVYLWDLDEGFAGVVLLKKEVKAEDAAWDSIHVFEVDERRSATSSRTAHYKLTSTVILHLGKSSESVGKMSLAGSMTRQVEADLVVESVGAMAKDGGHVCNVGRMVEDMESKMRNMLQEVYFGKAKDVVGDLRSVQPLTGVNRDRQTQKELIGSMGGR